MSDSAVQGSETSGGEPAVDQSTQMDDMNEFSPAAEPSEQSEPAEPAGEESDSSPSDERDSTIEDLRRQLDSLISEKDRVAATARQPESAPAQPTPTKHGYEEDHSFLGDDADLEQVFNDRASLNKLLNSVRLKAAQQAVEAAVERVSRTIPAIVRENAAQALIIQQKGQEFYAKNKDLASYRNVVVQVGNELYSKNPTWDIDKLYSEVAVEARKRLGLVKAAAASAQQPSNVRRFPKTPGDKGVKGTQKLEGLAAEIAAMNSVQD